jgi:hypothetical protein
MEFASVAGFLQAQADRLLAITPGSANFNEFYFTIWGFYLQDDFRVLPNLTVNLGLRYEPGSTIREGNGFNSALRDIFNDTEFTIGPVYANPTKRNIGPRVGFAWDVQGDGRTSVRGGFGVLYDVGNTGGTLDRIANGRQPFSSDSEASASARGVPFIPLPSLQFLTLVESRDVVGTSVQTLTTTFKVPTCSATTSQWSASCPLRRV